MITCTYTWSSHIIHMYYMCCIVQQCTVLALMYSIQDIRSLDKEMRAWDAFTGLDSTVKNMVTSLRAVGELQNPAIRERHWQQLMQATQVCLCGLCTLIRNQIALHCIGSQFILTSLQGISCFSNSFLIHS